MSEPPPDTTLSDLPIRSASRMALTGVLVVLVLGLFWAMVAKVLLAALLGAVVAVYLRPVHTRLDSWVGHSTWAAVLTLALLIVPSLAVLVYGYLEVRSAAEYLAQNAGSVAAQIQQAVAELPIVNAQIQASAQSLLETVADRATGVPAGVQDAIGAFGVAAAVFLFTAVYVLTDADEIVAYLRDKVPARYAGLTERLESNARGVLYGSIYATLVTQTIKGLWILTLMLVFGIPIPFTLALITFLIGFFPVVGSWTVYLPAAGYLLVFDDSPMKAVALVVIAFVVSTPLLSMYVRPKLAAEKSQVLNFYWMFLGLIAGVYTFGIPGIVLGPLTIGLLKALIDVVTDPDCWEPPQDPDGHDPTILVEEEMAQAG